MKFLPLLLLTTSIFAWDCSTVKHTNKDLPVDHLCRRAASYHTMDTISTLQHRENINFSTSNSSTREVISSAILRNAEECYITCLKSNSQRY